MLKLRFSKAELTVAEFFSDLLYILDKKQKIKKENVNLVWVKCPKV